MRRLIDTDALRAAGFADAADAIEAEARAEAELRGKVMAPPRPVHHRAERTTIVRPDGRSVTTTEPIAI